MNRLHTYIQFCHYKSTNSLILACLKFIYFLFRCVSLLFWWFGALEVPVIYYSLSSFNLCLHCIIFTSLKLLKFQESIIIFYPQNLKYYIYFQSFGYNFRIYFYSLLSWSSDNCAILTVSLLFVYMQWEPPSHNGMSDLGGCKYASQAWPLNVGKDDRIGECQAMTLRHEFEMTHGFFCSVPSYFYDFKKIHLTSVHFGFLL